MTHYGSKNSGTDSAPALCIKKEGTSIHEEPILEATVEYMATANRILAGTHLKADPRFVTFHESSILNYPSHDPPHNFNTISPTKKGEEYGVAIKNGSETSSP